MQDAVPRPCGLFGAPPPIVEVAEGARQFAPTMPGADALETAAAGSLAAMTMLAPPGTIERRYNLAAMLRALAPDAPFVALAPKTMGGARLAEDLAGFGCMVEASAKAHHRICRGRRSAALDEDAMDRALQAGAPRRVDTLGLWSQPGIFSWDRIDPGTALLLDALPALKGRGADLGCGVGVLAHAVLANAAVTRLDLVDVDRRAVEAARRNVDDARAHFAWLDVQSGVAAGDLDFVVMNPPFHESGREDRGLGQVFIRQAAAALRSGGTLWLVANRHLPYERDLGALFRRVGPYADAHGFKVVAAVK